MTSAYQSQQTQNKHSGIATIAISAADFLTKRGISPKTWESLGITEQNGALVIPYRKHGEIKNRKFRALNEKKFWQDGGSQFVWNFDSITDSTKPVIITEGEFDALSAIECGYDRVISIPNGGSEGEPNIQWAFEIEEFLGDEIILAFDDDNVGYALLERVSEFFGKARCKWVKYPKGCKDLNDALVKYGQEGVKQSIARARWFEVRGLYHLSELPPIPYRKPMAAGMGVIDDHIKLRLGDFSIVTGIPGHGKTTFTMDFLCRILEREGLRACVASFENPPQTDYRRTLRTWHVGKFEKDMTDEEKKKADEWIDKRFMFIVPDESDDVTMEWLMDRMEVGARRHNIRIFLIDPWNEMDHNRDRGETITEYVGKAIRLLKSFAKSRGVHVMVVAHPAKLRRDKNGKYPIPDLYDISDSQHWANKADLGIVVHRDEKGDTVRCVKSRHHTEIGKTGVVDVTFFPDTGRFMAIDKDAYNDLLRKR